MRLPLGIHAVKMAIPLGVLTNNTVLLPLRESSNPEEVCLIKDYILYAP